MGKVVTPKLDFPVPDQIWEHAAQNQRKSLGAIATKLDNLEPLDAGESMLAAAACRAISKQIPLKQPKKVGKQPTYDASLAAIQYASGKYTYQNLAEKYGVSIEALKKTLKVNGRLDAANSLRPTSTKNRTVTK